jgi:hypothetical protein
MDNQTPQQWATELRDALSVDEGQRANTANAISPNAVAAAFDLLNGPAFGDAQH